MPRSFAHGRINRLVFKSLMLLLTIGSMAASPAAPAGLTKTDLFEAGKNGYVLYRIPGVVVTKIRESS